MGKPWKFTQKGGELLSITLSGASAPHGRPRQGPVVTESLQVRHARTYYPGNSVATTHTFGTQWDDWELKGRFSDVWLGKGGTEAMVKSWTTLVAGQQEIEIAWGDVLSALGIVRKFTFDRESEFEGAYTIIIMIDDRSDAFVGRDAFELQESPLAICERLQALIGPNVDGLPGLPYAGDLKPDFLDSLEESVASINAVSASLVKVAGEIDAFSEATIDQLERLAAGAVQMRTAVNKLRSTLQATENDSALLARAANTDVQWFAERAALDVATTTMLAILVELDRQTEIARRSQNRTTYTARLGDTWEAIATQFFGGPEEAGAIRQANGVLYGAMPVPGRTYGIPFA